MKEFVVNFVNLGHLLEIAEKGELQLYKIRWFAWQVFVGVVENTSTDSIKTSLRNSRSKYEELKRKHLKKEDQHDPEDLVFNNPLMRGCIPVAKLFIQQGKLSDF